MEPTSSFATDAAFVIIASILLIGFGAFLMWIFWRFHILPNYYCRRARTITYAPPIKAEPPRL